MVNGEQALRLLEEVFADFTKSFFPRGHQGKWRPNLDSIPVCRGVVSFWLDRLLLVRLRSAVMGSAEWENEPTAPADWANCRLVPSLSGVKISNSVAPLLPFARKAGRIGRHLPWWPRGKNDLEKSRGCSLEC